MNRNTAPKASPTGPGQPGSRAPETDGGKPIDSDWPVRERAAEERAGDEDQGEPGDPRDLKDESALESLGKAVSSPVRDEIEPSARDGEPGKPKDD